MSFGGGKPQRKSEHISPFRPRRRYVPRREETVIALIPLPSGLLIKELTKQNRLIRSAFQPLSGELVPIRNPDSLPEMKDVRRKWRKQSAGQQPHQGGFKPRIVIRRKRQYAKSFTGQVKRSSIITPPKTLTKTLQVNGTLYPITGLDKVYRFAQTRSFLAGHRVATLFTSSSEVYKQIIPILDILSWGGQSPFPDFEDGGPSGGKGRR